MIGYFLLVPAFVLVPGCSRPQVTTPDASRQPAKLPLSSSEAARLAAKLANEQCQRQFQRQPFTPDQHIPRLTDAGYSWGGLNEGASGGLSALVTFAADGSNPHVEIYFSTDRLTPP